MPDPLLLRDPVAATVDANPGATTEQLAALFGCDPLAVDEYLWRMGRALALERDEQRRWWCRPGGRGARGLPPYDGCPDFQATTLLGVLGTLAGDGALRGARWQWHVHAMCAEGGPDADGTFTEPVPLSRSAAEVELAGAQQHGWWIVKRVSDRPPYTHHIAVRSSDGLGVWHFLVQLQMT
jgi:hypothetical protein